MLCLLKAGSFETGVFRLVFLGWERGGNAGKHRSSRRRRRRSFCSKARMDQPLSSDQLGGLLQLKKYGDLLPDEMWRPKLLEDENVRLKKIVAALTP